MRRFNELIAVFLVFGLFSVGCSSQATQPVVQRAKWCDSPPEPPPGYQYFITLSDPKSDESAARKDALNTARRRVIEFFGTEIKSEFQSMAKAQKDATGAVKADISIDTFTEQVSSGIVKSLVTKEWSITRTEDGRYQACIWTEISEFDMQESIEIARAKAAKEREQQISEISALMKSANQLIRQGKVVPALSTLKRAKDFLEKSKLVHQEYSLSSVDALEKKVTANITLTTPDPVTIALDETRTEQDLRVALGFTWDDQTLSIASFPLVFRYPGGQYPAQTLDDGSASLHYSIPKDIGNRTALVKVEPDSKILGPKMSETALSELKQKRITFQILYRPKALVTGNLHSDFLFKLWPENNKTTLNVNQVERVKYSCHQQRCYLKLFAFEDSGDVSLLKEINKQRLGVNETRSFKIGSDQPGHISVYGISSSEPFSMEFGSQRRFTRDKFKGIVESLRNNQGKKAEFILKLEVK